MTESSFKNLPARPDSNSARSRRSKRKKILEAAARVFAENGFHGTRISDIAKLAGVADGTIYLYFANKQALLICLFEETVQQFFGELHKRLESLDSAQAKLRQLISTELMLLDKEPALARLLTVNFRQSQGALRKHVTPIYDNYLQQIATILTEGQTRGEFRSDLDPQIAARAIFGALDGVILGWVLSPAPRRPLSDSAAALSDLVLLGATGR